MVPKLKFICNTCKFVRVTYIFDFWSEPMEREVNKNQLIIISSGFILVILQNIILFFSNISSTAESEFVTNTFSNLMDFEIVYVMDTLGFVLIGIGLILSYQNSSIGSELLASLGIFTWVVLRLIWQSQLDNAFDDFDIWSDSVMDLDSQVTFFLVANIALTIAIINLYRLSKNNIPLLIYGVLNFISSTTIFLVVHSSIASDITEFLTYDLKLIWTPLIGVVGLGLYVKHHLLEDLKTEFGNQTTNQ